MKKEVSKNIKTFDIITIVLAVLMLIIPLAFFFLLSQKTSAAFGFSEILFSVAFAIVTTLFLMWTKKMEVRNTYLGLVMGILALVAFEYSLFFKYKGPYTTIFAIITGVIVLAFLIINFFKYRKYEIKNVDDFEE